MSCEVSGLKMRAMMEGRGGGGSGGREGGLETLLLSPEVGIAIAATRSLSLSLSERYGSRSSLWVWWVACSLPPARG